METAPQRTACTAPKPPKPLDVGTLLEILWESVWQALVLAFLAGLFGGIVVGIVGGIWQDMTPSLPPGVAGKPHLEADPAPDWNFAWFRQNQFAILFALFFAVETVTRLARHSRNESQRNVAAWVAKARRRLSQEWFGLIVGNAFSAFVAVLFLQIVQQFSLTHLLWEAICSSLGPVLGSITGLVPGGGLFRALGSVAAWYNENQSKFLFWFLYSAAICDDLGLPNLKTLARFLWRRFFNSARAASCPDVAPKA